MSLKEQIMEAQKQAMKEKNAEVLSTIRMLTSAIKNEEIDSRTELTDEQVQQVVARQVKQLNDSIVDFQKGGREDLVTQAAKEVQLLTTFLPEQLSDAELQLIVKEVIEAAGATSAQDVGKVMGTVMQKVKGKADGQRVRAMVSTLLV